MGAETRGERIHVVILSQYPPTDNVRSLLRSTRYMTRVTYVMGSLKSMADMTRVDLTSADVVYLTDERSASTEAVTDEVQGHLLLDLLCSHRAYMTEGPRLIASGQKGRFGSKRPCTCIGRLFADWMNHMMLFSSISPPSVLLLLLLKSTPLF